MQGLSFLSSLEAWSGQGGFSPKNISAVLDYFGNPQDKIPSVHIAGTNGKGSVSAAIASILGVSGYKVGLSISPHLVRQNERVVIDGYSISDEDLDSVSLELKGATEKLGLTLTYHEAITAVAFLMFWEKKVDWMVIEVGLGGRLDSSNVLSCPKACVISSIGLDHQAILGLTRAEIAMEKAGIIKRGSVLFTAKMDDEALQVIECEAKNAGIRHVKWGRDYAAQFLGNIKGNGYFFNYQNNLTDHEARFNPSLKGCFQGNNMALALAVCEELEFPLDKCLKGVGEVFWPARFERISAQDTDIIIDCAHNIDGVEALVESLKLEGLEGLRIGFGCLDTKNWKEMIKILVPVVSSWNLLLPQSTRAVPNSEISDFLSCFGISSKDYGLNYESFLSDELGKGQGPLLLAGSMYMVGMIRSFLIKDEQAIWKRQI